jgi:hypothetical protein
MPCPLPLNPLAVRRQTGALFGLDARIALAIFAVLTLIAGYTVVGSMDSNRAKSLAGELTDMGKAVEAIHNDLKTDIFQALDEPSEKNAFAALFDDTVITENGNLRSKWLGPYITFTSTLNPKYGEMVIQKHPANHTQDCSPEEVCYLWVVYGSVKMGIISEVNEIIDGKESGSPELSGRLQWTQDRDNGILYYRAAKALSLNSN